MCWKITPRTFPVSPGSYFPDISRNITEFLLNDRKSTVKKKKKKKPGFCLFFCKITEFSKLYGNCTGPSGIFK